MISLSLGIGAAAGIAVGMIAMRWLMRARYAVLTTIARFENERAERWQKRARRAEAPKSKIFFLPGDSPVEDLIAISRRELL